MYYVLTKCGKVWGKHTDLRQALQDAQDLNSIWPYYRFTVKRVTHNWETAKEAKKHYTPATGE